MRADQHGLVRPSPRLRFAPSPTGALHIGGARTALYNWLLARRSGGDARPADRGHRPRALDARERRADPRRARAGSSSTGTRARSRQYERRDRHREVLSEPRSRAAHAYRDPRRPTTSAPARRHHGGPRLPRRAARGRGRGDPPAGARRGRDRRRRRDPRATSTSRTAHMDDFVIARADGTPLYNLAVAVDDADMGITHVVRGDDHLSNTPKQLLVLRGARRDPPIYAHLPLLHGPDGKQALQAPRRRLGAGASRRRLPAGGGAQLPGAARAGGPTTTRRSSRPRSWSSASRSSASGASPAVFDEQKLRWMNGRYMRELPLEDVRERSRALRSRRSDAEAVRRAPATELPARRLRDRAGQGPDARRGFWPLVRFLFDGPADDPKAREKVMTPEAAPRSGAARATRCAAVERVRRRARSSGPLARRGRAPRREAQGRLPADARRDHRAPPSRRGSSRRSRCSGATSRSRRIDAALARLGD